TRFSRDWSSDVCSSDLVDVRFDQLPDDVQLLVGYSADIEVITDHRDNTVRIPTEALLEGNQVLTLSADGTTLQQQAVTIGLSNWTWTEILAGLEEGQKILTRLDNPAAVAGARVILVPETGQQP